MSDFDVRKEFDTKLRKLEATDPVHADRFNNLFGCLVNNDAYIKDQNNNMENPEFDDSGKVNGITDFPSFLSSLVSGMNLFKFFTNLKAGLQFVVHTGRLINNGTCVEPGYALDARYGKILFDGITKLNSDLGDIKYVYKQSGNGGEDYSYDPTGFVKSVWDSLPENCQIIAKLICGQQYAAFIQRYRYNSGYGSVLIMGYDSAGARNPIYMRMEKNTWIIDKLTLNNDLKKLRGYEIVDHTYTNDQIKDAVQYYYNQIIDDKTNFVLFLELVKGNSFNVSGVKADCFYGSVIVQSYGIANLLCGRLNGGVWTWVEK